MGIQARPRTRGRALAVILTVLSLTSLVVARDNLFASAYGSFTRDLLEAFHAQETTCNAAIEAVDVCFHVDAVGAGHLAEVLSGVVEDYDSAGLQLGDWTAANGVWAVELRFKVEAYGKVDIYLSEVGRGVRGMLVHTQR